MIFRQENKLLRRAVLYGLVAAVFYFLLAFFANRGHVLSLRLRVSVVHGMFCMAMTFLSTGLLEFFFDRFSTIEKKYFGAIFCAGSVVLILMTGVHLALGTPEIFRTVFYSALLSLPYYFLLPLKLILDWEKSHSKYGYRKDQNWAREWPVKMFSSPYLLMDLVIVLKNNIFKPRAKGGSLEVLPHSSTLNSVEPKIKLVFLGDIMPTYSKVWTLCSEVKEIVRDCDYLICNFEGSLHGNRTVALSQVHRESILASLKTLKSPDRIVLSLANNHAADFGYSSFLKTWARLEDEGFKVIGKRDQAALNLENMVNLVAATEWSNQHHGYLSFLEFANSHLDKSRFNILYPHWGHELEHFPRPSEIARAQELTESWDAIIGHHSHVPGPITEINSKLVAFSLGDSATGLPRRRYKRGQIIAFDVGLDSQNSWKLGRLQWHYTNLLNSKTENHLTLSQN